MDSRHPEYSAIDAEGLSVSVDTGVLAASLRYFDPRGSFVASVLDAVGGPLPGPLRALRAQSATDPEMTLVWRGPTETLLLCQDPQAFMQLERRLAGQLDGCMVEQTGGIRVIRVQGSRTDHLLACLGANTVCPALGEARTGRLAELQVTAIRIQAQEVLLLIESAYADHLLEWIAVTVNDF